MLPIFLILSQAVASGQPSDAEATWRAALEHARAFGEQNPRFALAAEMLAGVLLDRGKYIEAKGLLEVALPVLEASMGADHPQVAAYRFELAKCYSELGRHGEAERLFLAAQPPLERVLGESHPRIAVLLVELGALYRMTGRCTESETVLLRAVKIHEAALGSENLLTSQSQAQLGATYYCLGQYVHAMHFLRRSLAVFEKFPPHPALVSILVNLGKVHLTLRKLDEAEAAWRRALLMLDDFPEAYKLRASTLCNLGTLKLLQRRGAEAEPLILQAAAIFETRPDRSGDIAPILESLANLYASRGEFDRADSMYARALDVAEPESLVAASILRSAGRLRIIQKRLHEAATFLQRALAIYERILGTGHPFYGGHLAEYAALLRKMNRKNEAKELEAQARAIADANRINAFTAATVDVRELKKR